MSAGTRSRLPTRGSDDFRTVFAMSVWSAITLIAAALISRRVAGAFRADIGAATPCVAATVACLASMAAHALWSSANSALSGRKQFVAAAATLIPPLALAGAFWTSPSALIGGYLAALMILSVLATIVIRDLSTGAAGRTQWFPIDLPQGPATSPISDHRARCSHGGNHPEALCPPSVAAEVNARVTPDETNEETIDEEAGAGDPSILQWMTRRQLADGAETVEGSVRIHFAPGERSAVAHVSFVPPLSDRPRAECQVFVDFDGRVRIGVAQAYGLRIEARRSDSPPHGISIDIGFSAHVRAAQKAAA
jgi:hypothetical protein